MIWILLGSVLLVGIMGWVSSRLTNRNSSGCLEEVGVGLVGSIFGIVALSYMSLKVGGPVIGFLMAMAGTIVLAGLAGVISKAREKRKSSSEQ